MNNDITYYSKKRQSAKAYDANKKISAENIEKLKEYEVRINSFFSENDILAICQYNRNRFSSEVILHVLRTHPIIISGDLVCKNESLRNNFIAVTHSTLMSPDVIVVPASN